MMLLLTHILFILIISLDNVFAITVTAPLPGQQVSLAKPFQIRWTMDA